MLKSRRQTANIEVSDNFAGVSDIPNFYDDNMDIVEFDVVGITHPDALKYYKFELIDFTKIDDNLVFEIEVSSKRKLQPLFEGTIFVQDIEYALLSVRLKPNSVIVFPKPVQKFNLYFEQQFSNFGGEFWLPVDYRMEGLVELGVPGLRFPPIGFKQVSKLNDYKVNVDLPDSLYEDFGWVSVDSTTIDKPDSMFVNTIETIPLSKKEEDAYETLDSTATLEKAFRPKGFLVRFLGLDEDGGGEITVSTSAGSSKQSATKKEPSAIRKFVNNLRVEGRYNRVDAIYGGLVHERRFADRRVQTNFNLGYSFGYEEINTGVNVVWWPLKKTRRFALEAGFEQETSSRYSSDLYGMVSTSGMALFGYDDYFDFYRREGTYMGVRYRPRRSWDSRYSIQYRLEDHSSIDFKTSYDVFGRSNNQRLNPAVNEGTLSSIELKFEKGEGKKALGVVGADNIMLSIEQSVKAMGSDWNFTRFKVDIYRRYTTFYKRRFIPNSLDLRFNAGTYIGDLPVQRNGVLDASFGYFTPFGGFKSKRYIPFEGASYTALNIEHNFRSTPFEALGIPRAAEAGISFITFAGVGRTWLSSEQKQFFNSTIGYTPSSTNDWFTEVGVSISNIFTLFRIDLAYRIDKPGIYPGIALARLF